MEEIQIFVIYKQMLLPYFDYASFLIDCATEDLIKKVQKIENRALRICRYSNMYERSSATELHTHYLINFLDQRRYTQLHLIMFKKSQVHGLLTPLEDRRTRGDHKIKFNVAPNRLTSSDKNPWSRGIMLWDKLDEKTQKLEKKLAFKHKVKHLVPPKRLR